MIIQPLRNLTKNPVNGNKTGQGYYRSVSIWSFIIIYTVTEKDVRVLNVVHSSQNPESREDI
ncbi:MAG: type II toxin-antitoxin system RelE/ParE family toxin [Promethearchaeia archaeon]